MDPRAIGVLALAVLITYVAIVATNDVDSAPQPLPPSRYDQRIAELDREAIEQAYKNQIMVLYQGWMKDHYDQPQRAAIGAQHARKAFIEAMTAIDQRP